MLGDEVKDNSNAPLVASFGYDMQKLLRVQSYVGR